jgi:hypothetical protein
MPDFIQVAISLQQAQQFNGVSSESSTPIQ